MFYASLNLPRGFEYGILPDNSACRLPVGVLYLLAFAGEPKGIVAAGSLLASTDAGTDDPQCIRGIATVGVSRSGSVA